MNLDIESNQDIDDLILEKFEGALLGYFKIILFFINRIY